MPYLSEFLSVLVIHTLGLVSPGPDFLMITKNSLVYPRRMGVYSSVGLAMSILVHVTYCLIGIGLIISKSILLFSLIKFLGAGYLIFIGYKSLRSKKKRAEPSQLEVKRDLSKWGAVRMGFVTNLLNPKATLFFLAILTQVIHPETPKSVQVFYELTMSGTTFIYFAMVAGIFSHQFIRSRISSIQNRLEKIFGVLLIALGIKVAFSASK